MDKVDEALSTDNRREYVMTLYVTGASQASQRAIANLNDICEQYLEGRCEVEVVDIYKFPRTATEAHVLATPTLVKKLPEPMRTLIGDLSQKDRVLLLLDLKKK